MTAFCWIGDSQTTGATIRSDFLLLRAATRAKESNGGQVTDFKEMVRELHRAGLEVIIDVVYNHTAEGNHLGPTLSFKGVDNAAYYRLVANDRRFYMDYTGCGNTPEHPKRPSSCSSLWIAFAIG